MHWPDPKFDLKNAAFKTKRNSGRMVTNEIPVESVNDVLSSMTDFGTVGFQVINSW
jgi:hypothetical protein